MTSVMLLPVSETLWYRDLPSINTVLNIHMLVHLLCVIRATRSYIPRKQEG